MKKLFSPIVLLIMYMCSSIGAQAQCPYPSYNCACPVINMPPNAYTCAGTPYMHDFSGDILVPPGLTVLDWSWSPSGAYPPSGGMSTLPGVTAFWPATSTTYALTVTAAGPNMLNDGDFASWSPGTPCFNTGYTYLSGSLWASPGCYAVDVTSNPYFGPPAITDHSHTVPGAVGPYNMLIAKGGTIPVTTTKLWEEIQIPVCPDADYYFSFWLANVLSSGGASVDAQIMVMIDGISYGTYMATGTGVWQQQIVPYHSPAMGGLITIQLYNVQKSMQLDGFAIDDISFNRICKSTGYFKVDVTEITGPTSVCNGSTITLTGNPAGGTWSCPGATISSSGELTGLTVGPVAVTYTDPFGCTIHKIINVFANPVSLSGPGSTCEYNVETFTGAPSGLAWYSTPGIVSSLWPGTYRANSAGTAIITYSDPSTGCFATKSLTIHETPTDLPVQYLCIGDHMTFTVSPSGGTWTSSNTAVATIGLTTGYVTAVAPGYATIVYTTADGCTTFTTVNVYNCAGGVAIGGGSSICEDGTRTLIGLPSGGTWTSGNTAVATVNPVTGVVTGVVGGGGGSVTFTYTFPSGYTTTSIYVTPPVTACISLNPYYEFAFVTGCAGTASVHFVLRDGANVIVGNPSGYWISVPPGGTTMSFTDVGSLPYGSYTPSWNFYRVCVDKVSCGGCISKVDCCVNRNGTWKHAPEEEAIPEAVAALELVPNPTNGTFTVRGQVDANDGERATIDVIDMMGRTVQTDAVQVQNEIIDKQLTLNNNLPNGIYMVRIHTSKSGQMIRLELNR